MKKKIIDGPSLPFLIIFFINIFYKFYRNLSEKYSMFKYKVKFSDFHNHKKNDNTF